MTKREIRQQIREERRGLTLEQRDLKDQLIFNRAHKDGKFQVASRILVYVSTAEEVDTAPFIEYAWGIGKEVFVPRIAGETLHHVRITRSTIWHEGPFGIREPVVNEADIVLSDRDLQEGDVIVIPMVAFDTACNRLGYGKGYYDRILANRSLHALGLAYELQKIKQLPVEPHDIPLTRICTEERWYNGR